MITPSDAAASASHNLEQAHPGSGTTHSAGKGELTSATAWDEFPNGRFGDSKSPAFGLNDLWDAGLGISVSEFRFPQNNFVNAI